MTPGCETPHERAKRHLKDGGYAGGHGEAKSDASSDQRMIRSAITQHDDQLHGGKKTRLKFKRGGAVEGKEADCRPDRRARGGKIPMNGVVHVDRRYEAEGINQPHGPEKRADGGAMHHKGGKGKIGAVNIAIKAGGGQAEKQMAAQKGLQAGIQIGARQAAAKMGGAPAGGPPPGGMPPGAMPPGPMAGPPPGGPPPGGMMPGPGPMRPPGGMAGGPPPGAMPPPRPPGMMANGGVMRRDAHGRFAGGGV